MALSQKVQTQIQAVCLKLNTLDPGWDVTANNARLTAALNTYTTKPGGQWGGTPWTIQKARAWCDWVTSLGVDVTAIRTFCGV